MSEPRAPRDSLARMLEIEDQGGGVFRARLESFWGAATPGDLLARATLVATQGGPDAPSAAQAIFPARALPELELRLEREDLAAERRRVRAWQGGELVCEVTFRFGPAGDGPSYQCIAPDAGLPAPEDLPSERELGEAEGWGQYAVGPVEARRIGAQTPVQDDEPAVWLGWLRPREALGTGARLHAAALAFVSEYRSHWAVERRLGADFPRSEITLLDHALWVHRAACWDDWWLVRTRSDVGVSGRCFSRREIHTRRGALIASAAWEAAVRPRG